MVSKVRNFWLCVFSGVVATTLIGFSGHLQIDRMHYSLLTVGGSDIMRYDEKLNTPYISAVLAL